MNAHNGFYGNGNYLFYRYQFYDAVFFVFKPRNFFNGALSKRKSDNITNWFFGCDIFFQQDFVKTLNRRDEIVDNVPPDIVGSLYLNRRAVCCF
jgi:hypothetical protein